MATALIAVKNGSENDPKQLLRGKTNAYGN
jgi:hypothetical protein